MQKRLTQDDTFEERLKAIFALFSLDRDGFERRGIRNGQFPAKREGQKMPGERLHKTRLLSQ